LNHYNSINKHTACKLSLALASLVCILGPVQAATASKQAVEAQANERRSVVFIGAASNDLGLALLKHKKTAGNEALGNDMVSPWGLTNILGMLHSSTDNQTSNEIHSVFTGRLSKKSSLGQQVKSLNTQLHADQNGVVFKNANRLWIAANLAETIKPALVTDLQDLYASNVTPLVSNDPKSAAQAVNTWVSQATANHIPVIVTEQSLSKNAKAVAVNAVYFNGNWSKPFLQGENRMMNFTTEQSESVPVPAMMGTLDVKLSEQDGFQVIEIPFNNPNYAMLVLLPNGNNAGLQHLQDKLTGHSFLDFLDQGKATEISLELPKFKILPKASGIKNSLAALGINQIFSQGADFSPLSSSSALTIDDIYHAAGIRVDESGVEAKSSSAAVLNAKSLKLDVKKLAVNRPFMFALVYRPAATALFLGYVNKPEF